MRERKRKREEAKMGRIEKGDTREEKRRREGWSRTAEGESRGRGEAVQEENGAEER